MSEKRADDYDDSSEMETDYLIVGAGISGLAFADELFTQTQARMIIVDKRHAPGGHWNDSYPFVRLHQPGTFYGVESTELTDYRIEKEGPNKGFLSLSTGPEIIAYCHALLRDRLIASGRVKFLPYTEYRDGKLHGLLSDGVTTVHIRKKLVDATYYTNNIPSRHIRKFTVDEPSICIAPNVVPQLAGDYNHFTVLGAGKTGMDTCLFLLQNGTDPRRIRWVMPRDPWCVNRAKYQTGDEFFESVFSGIAEVNENMASATSFTDMAHRYEKIGFWLRLDPNIEPSVFRGPTLSEGELEQLRLIKDVVRLGRVQHISTAGMTLERGRVTNMVETLYIDCTATAITPVPAQRIFQPGKIVLQLIRFPQIPFSCAYLAAVEALLPDDESRNAHAFPMDAIDGLDWYVRAMATDFQNRAAMNSHPQLRKWVRQSRLDGFQRMLGGVRPDDKERLEILARVKESTVHAAMNMPRLVKSLDTRPKL